MNTLTVQPAQTVGIPPEVQRLDYASRLDGFADWALAWPEPPGARWLVMLHGHGSHGDQLYTRPDIRDRWLPLFRQLGFGLLTPNLRDNAWMSPPAVADLHDLLDAVRARWQPRDFVFFSGSMGGTGNLVYAVRHPGDVAAVAALGAAPDPAAYREWCRAASGAVARQIGDAIESAYGGPPSAAREAYRAHRVLGQTASLRMPLFLAHGECDTLMPVEPMRALAAELAGRLDVAWTEIPKGGHDAPLFMPEAYDWLRRLA